MKTLIKLLSCLLVLVVGAHVGYSKPVEKTKFEKSKSDSIMKSNSVVLVVMAAVDLKANTAREFKAECDKLTDITYKINRDIETPYSYVLPDITHVNHYSNYKPVKLNSRSLQPNYLRQLKV